VPPDERAWTAGRFEGLRGYCTLGNALNEGRRATRITGSPGSDRTGLSRIARSRLRGARANRRVRDIESQISSRERDLRKDGRSDRDRERIRSEIRDLDRRRESARSDVSARARSRLCPPALPDLSLRRFDRPGTDLPERRRRRAGDIKRNDRGGHRFMARSADP
jgi:hypothetical protein